MTRIVYDTATTINGFLATPENSLEWLFAVPDEGVDTPDAEPLNPRVLVMGSTTYRWVLEAERLLEEEEHWGEWGRGDFLSRTIVVFSSQEQAVPSKGDVRVVSGTVAAALPAIREAAGEGDVWVQGGGELAAQFLEAGALDQIRLSVAPAALSAGAPLLPRDLSWPCLRLASVAQTGHFARLIYDVIGEEVKACSGKIQA